MPTEQLIALHRERWSGHLAALRHVLPEAEAYRNALANAEFFRNLVLAMGEGYAAGLRLLDQAPGLEMFVERNAGMVILLSLSLAGPAEEPFPPTGPVPLSINALATTFSVSRKHILTLLRDAQADGLLLRSHSGDEVTILPVAREALEVLHATILLFLAHCAERASRSMSDAAPLSVARAG